MLYSEWLDQDVVGRIQLKSPPIIFSLASLVLEGTLANCSLFNIPSIILRPDKYNKMAVTPATNSFFRYKSIHQLPTQTQQVSKICSLNEVKIVLTILCESEPQSQLIPKPLNRSLLK